MSPRERTPSFDGDQGAIRRYTIRDGAVRDLASAAVEVYYETEKGVSLGMVPGVIVGVKSGGKIDVMLRGRETDFDGLGGTIVEIPKVYYATAPDGTPAVNLLTNPSFDTDTTPANGIADGWSVAPAATGLWLVYATDSAPPTIFGSFQHASPAAGTATEYIYQDNAPGGGVATGDIYSGGLWMRGDRITGVLSDGHALYLELHGPGYESNISQFPIGSSDWRFYKVKLTAAQIGNANVRLKVTTSNSNLGSRRFDEAFLFKGEWMAFFGERKRIPVKPCGRPTKNTNQIAGFGSFEQDSDANGIADGWAQVGVANTYSINQDPAHVAVGSKSQKVAPGNGAPDQMLYQRHRGKANAGEVWAASVKYKNSGALTGTPNASEFGIELRTDYFDSVFTNAATAFALTSTPGFVTVTVQLTLLADANVLVVRLALAKITGANIWLDDVQLWRVSP